MICADCASDDDSDDEDDTAALMAELAKIKQERAEEKARIVSLSSPPPIPSPFPDTPTEKFNVTNFQ